MTAFSKNMTTVAKNICTEWQIDNDLQGKILRLDCDEWTATENNVMLIIGIKLSLSSLYGKNLKAEIEWLNLSRKKLNNQSPIEYMSSGNYKNISVISEMLVKERGIY